MSKTSQNSKGIELPGQLKKLFWTAKTPKVCQNHKRLRNVTHNTSETALQLFIPELLKIKTLVKAWLLVDTVLLHK